MSVIVVMPSRGRPARALEAVCALRRLAVLPDTRIVVAIDDDDPTAPDYRALAFGDGGPGVSLWTLAGDETGDLVRATNTVSMALVREERDAVVANLGDDHVVRTWGWDRMVSEALATPGIAYGDDLLQGEMLPTAPFISASIVRALGWYALPTCRHLWIDDAWRELGRAIGALRYLPDLVIEHCHPAVGKADLDEGYERANAPAVIEHDHAAYLAWRNGPLFPMDVSNVRRALSW